MKYSLLTNFGILLIFLGTYMLSNEPGLWGLMPCGIAGGMLGFVSSRAV